MRTEDTNTQLLRQRSVGSEGAVAPLAKRQSAKDATGGPPDPRPVDPHGPETTRWPPGLFNFANVIVAVSIVVVLLVLMIGLIARQ